MSDFPQDGCRDTRTVIADNEKISEIERLKAQLASTKEWWAKGENASRERVTDLVRERNIAHEEIERLKRSLELYRADIGVMREREEKMAAERTAMREEIERLNRDLVNRTHCTQAAINARREMEIEATRLTVENQALRDAASDGRVVTIGISQPGKHENTTLGDALHQIAEGLNQLIEEIEEIEV